MMRNPKALWRMAIALVVLSTSAVAFAAGHKTVPKRDDPRVLFGVDAAGYFEHPEAMDALRKKSPAVFNKMQDRAKNLKDSVEQAQLEAARDGKPLMKVMRA